MIEFMLQHFHVHACVALRNINFNPHEFTVLLYYSIKLTVYNYTGYKIY